MSMNNLNHALPRVRHRKGFTLIELLIVISIIAILAGLLIPIVGVVRRRGQVTATVMEIQSLKKAIDTYKNTTGKGDYPPDGSNALVLVKHILNAFPRIHTTEMNFLKTQLGIRSYPNGNVIPQNTLLDPAEALVFFLGGFSDDPRYPFQGKGGPASLNRNPGLFDFDPNRLLTTDDGDGFAAYYPRGSDVPFVYFDSRTYMPRSIYGYAPAAQYPLVYNLPTNPNDVNGVARPYRSDQPREATPDDGYFFHWVNKNTFQLIAAGVTNHYGNNILPAPLNGRPTPLTRYQHYPSGIGPPTKDGATDGVTYSDGDKSNITSFSQGTLENDIP
ncbi:MAG: type II secretion system protein [Planctomycetaceae bacterium]|nr:type II secretion system protein [Planctomycetaceae bacterium]